MKEVLILNTKRVEFKDEKGEIVMYTSTTIALPAETTPNFKGYILEDITGSVEHFNKISEFVGQTVKIDFEYRKVDKKNYRAKLLKINNIPLK